MSTSTEQANTQGINTLFGIDHGSDSVPLAAIHDRANWRLNQFTDYAQTKLEELNIYCPPAISFISCPTCQIKLDNSHPQSAEIAAWIKSDIQLVEYFKRVEVLFELIRASEHAGETLPADVRFHIALTLGGPVAYFEKQIDASIT